MEPMEYDIILSVRRKWSRKIFSGEKTTDLRKSIPTREGRLRRVYLYECGTGCVAGEATVWAFWVSTPPGPEIPGTCVPSAELVKYAGNDGLVYGWMFYTVREYQTPIPLSVFGLKRPPQSWQYITDIEINDELRKEKAA